MITPKGIFGAAFGGIAEGNPRVDEDARRDVSAGLGITQDWAWARQLHGDGVIQVTGSGVAGDADGLFTADPSVPVAVSVADCFPIVLLADGAAGIAHAGWRGVAAGVVPATMAAMKGAGHPVHTVVVGPGIGPCCFEVGEEVAARFVGYTSVTTWGSPSVDLAAAVAGSVESVRVVRSGDCTHHDDRFHSYRRTGTDERQFGLAWLART